MPLEIYIYIPLYIYIYFHLILLNLILPLSALKIPMNTKLNSAVYSIHKIKAYT